MAAGPTGAHSRCLLLAAVLALAQSNNLYYDGLPDGVHDLVVVGRQGGLYLTGFDSRRRVCLVLYAPPLGQPLRTVAELPYRDFGRYTPTVLAARDPERDGSIYVLLYLHPDNLGLEQGRTWCTPTPCTSHAVHC